jgi:hypothetical protein
MFPYPRVYHLVVLPSKAFYRARSLSLIFTGTCEKTYTLGYCTLVPSRSGRDKWQNQPGPWGIFAPVYEDAPMQTALKSKSKMWVGRSSARRLIRCGRGLTSRPPQALAFTSPRGQTPSPPPTRSNESSKNGSKVAGPRPEQVYLFERPKRFGNFTFSVEFDQLLSLTRSGLCRRKELDQKRNVATGSLLELPEHLT